ncbi:MAG: mannose-1-phosphate guanylyltransferase [Pseudohongiellaceae bacterium]|jgi:mannose-1-phosphate guanylyltransferase
MTAMYAVLMAGGSGTRFWPASRQARPKQLLPIGGDLPLLVETSERLGELIPPERQFVITSQLTVDAVRALLPGLPPEQVVGEPEGRDTAPCLGLAGRLVAAVDPDALVVAMPSDHVITPPELFREHLELARDALDAHPERLLVFGIEPTHPATGYGYLRQGAVQGEFGGKPIYKLDAFIEKPKLERAKALLAEGGYSWNAGLFAFRPKALRDAFLSHLPDMVPGLDAIADAFGSDKFESCLNEVFPTLQKVSIDVGVMEKLDGTLMLPLPVNWNDVGSWTALENLKPADDDGNVIVGEAVLLNTTSTIVSADGGVVAARGVDGLIIVHTPDATMVCRRDDDQGVKDIVAALRARGLEAYL